MLEKFPVGATSGLVFRNSNKIIYIKRIDDSATIADLITD